MLTDGEPVGEHCSVDGRRPGPVAPRPPRTRRAGPRTKTPSYCIYVVQVEWDLEVSQALIVKEFSISKISFFRMQRAQAGYYTKKIYIRVGDRNPVCLGRGIEDQIKLFWDWAAFHGSGGHPVPDYG